MTYEDERKLPTASFHEHRRGDGECVHDGENEEPRRELPCFPTRNVLPSSGRMVLGLAPARAQPGGRAYRPDVSWPLVKKSAGVLPDLDLLQRAGSLNRALVALLGRISSEFGAERSLLAGFQSPKTLCGLLHRGCGPAQRDGIITPALDAAAEGRTRPVMSSKMSLQARERGPGYPHVTSELVTMCKSLATLVPSVFGAALPLIAAAGVDPTGGGIIPSARVTTWQPGLTYNGGIPHRTTIYETLRPRGAGLDDTAQIQAALDRCPANQVVFLTAGTFNVSGNGLHFRTSNCTLRGSGSGAFADGVGGTRLVKADSAINASYAVLYVNNGPGLRASVDLASDAMQGTNFLTLVNNSGIRVGEIVLLDENTDSNPDVFWGPDHDPPGGGSRRWFARQDRSLSQLMEVAAVSGNMVTFNTPFHTTFKTAYQAQLTRYTKPFLRGVGIEDLFVTGGRGGDYHGNISLSHCAYCWIQNVNASHAVGTAIGFYSTFRSELRDSYIHESDDPNPGGAGYLTGLNVAASENLFENNVMWYGNKVIVMRASGGGNVVAYNYMDDAFGSYYPQSPEAGLNAGHYTTPHMELLEGNYSYNYKGDSFWGNSIDITVFRNWLSALRAAHPPLDAYTFSQSRNCILRYGDYHNRTAVDVQAYSYRTNFVGNVLGMSGQQLLGYNSNSCFDSFQHSFLAEHFEGVPAGSEVVMWNVGSWQTNAGWSWVPTTIETQLRQGNWDWVSKRQSWDGVGGTGSTGQPQPIPKSLYLANAPAFFGNNPWPWVDPVTGRTHTLPAKYCFEHNQMPTCLRDTNQ